jgi:septum site-determining protein MinC
MHLRPLQLRIADAVARGPADPPADGQAEAAYLLDGEIRIDPATPSWPLPD